MLTADLVRARRAKGELRLIALDAKARAGALDTAAALIAVAEAHVGERRDAFDEACAAVVAAAPEPRLAAGVMVWSRRWNLSCRNSARYAAGPAHSTSITTATARSSPAWAWPCS